MGVYQECSFDFLSGIKKKVEEHSTPPDLVLNADETPSTYVFTGAMTMAKRGEKNVAMKGLADKRAITLTFTVILTGEFLPMQVIYGGKTTASQPRGFKFPDGFYVSQNPKHWSNKDETKKLTDTIINPFVVNKRKELKLAPTQKYLLVWDMFKARETQAVKDKLAKLDIEVVLVPANMTHYFQLLDLTVNGVAKKFMRNEFTSYYSEQVLHQLQAGTSEDKICVDLKLTTIKPLHAQWLVNLFNFMTTEKGKEHIFKGWKKASVAGLVDGTTVLPEEDPFQEIYVEK